MVWNLLARRILTTMNESTAAWFGFQKHYRFDVWYRNDIYKSSAREVKVIVVQRDFKEISTNLGMWDFKYLKVFVKANRCFSGKDSGSSIKQMNEQISLPPIEIVTIFQSYLKLTLLSCLIRWTKAFACED